MGARCDWLDAQLNSLREVGVHNAIMAAGQEREVCVCVCVCDFFGGVVEISSQLFLSCSLCRVNTRSLINSEEYVSPKKVLLRLNHCLLCMSVQLVDW